MNRPGQVRRHARRMRRYGLRPMIVMGTDDRLPETLGVLFARLLWRYRSELTPVSVAVALLSAGWVLHATHPSWWPGILALATVASAGCYLVTDEAVTETAARHAGLRPALDEVSQQAITGRAQTHPDEPVSPADPQDEASAGSVPADDRDAPDVILWAALSLAMAEGATVPELMAETGMSRPWVYQRLASLAQRDQVIQVSRGHWRAAPGQAP